jgi:hypothetical protein
LGASILVWAMIESGIANIAKIAIAAISRCTL